MSSQQSNTSTEVLEPASSAENTVNGVNVAALLQTADAVKANPVIAKFRFGVKNDWIDGTHNRSAVNEFHGATQDIERSKTFLLDADEHPILLGRDLGPNAGEYLLHALAACVTSTPRGLRPTARRCAATSRLSTSTSTAKLRGRPPRLTTSVPWRCRSARAGRRAPRR